MKVRIMGRVPKEIIFTELGNLQTLNRNKLDGDELFGFNMDSF